LAVEGDGLGHVVATTTASVDAMASWDLVRTLGLP
jgi:hypothetical protein